MSDAVPMYPLRFAPIFQYRLWGGRKLAAALDTELPGDGPIGEAWILSDRDDFASEVAEGALTGKTIAELISTYPTELLGSSAGRYTRYPLLLKYLDAREMLSVQVHPSDQHPDLLPSGERGKTEAWVVLESESDSKIFAGLKPGTGPEDLRHLNSANADQYLASFTPAVGEGVFIEAGTVHALGGGVVVFEVQQNSDVTFRLFDWDRVDAKTGKSRELHIDDAIACTNFSQGELKPAQPVEVPNTPGREEMFSCEFFETWRTQSDQPFQVGTEDALRALVIVDGKGVIAKGTETWPVSKGDVFLLPAVLGACQLIPEGKVTILAIAVP